MSAPAKTPERRPSVTEAIERPDHIPVVDAAGEYASFTLKGFAGLRRVGDYAGEALRQASMIALGSMLVILWISFLAGATCGLEGSAISRALGTGIAAPIFSAFCTTREIVPFIFGFIVAAKIGGGIVAELGAMRVNEEVDALEVMGIPSLPFLVTTRMIAGFIAVIPLYVIGLLSSYVATRLIATGYYGQSKGTYDHYFHLFLPPGDVLWSFLKVLVFAVVIILIHCYYGYTASGGPAGVGMAVGKAVRTSIVAINLVDFFLSLAIWGATTTVRLAG